jgi:hypothetical protein
MEKTYYVEGYQRVEETFTINGAVFVVLWEEWGNSMDLLSIEKDGVELYRGSIPQAWYVLNGCVQLLDEYQAQEEGDFYEVVGPFDLEEDAEAALASM